MLKPFVDHLEEVKERIAWGDLSEAHRTYNKWRAVKGKSPCDYGNFYRMLQKKHKDAWPHLLRAFETRKKKASDKAKELIRSGMIVVE